MRKNSDIDEIRNDIIDKILDDTKVVEDIDGEKLKKKALWKCSGVIFSIMFIIVITGITIVLMRQIDITFDGEHINLIKKVDTKENETMKSDTSFNDSPNDEADEKDNDLYDNSTTSNSQSLSDINVSLINAVYFDSLEEIKTLVKQGADLKTCDELGNNLLVLSFSYEFNKEQSQYLIDNGLDVNSFDDQGNPLILRALWTKDTKSIKFLLDNGADINAKSKKQGWTVLYYYVFMGGDDLSFVKYLVDNGADINVVDEDGYSMLDTVELMDEKKQDDIKKYLIQKGAILKSLAENE